ncbi:MAG: AAA family ATPase [Chlorobaculum sp.]|jgi:guanylate kinase|nr:AAA family ATPase [Chlorobaculum sp.]
MNKKIPNFFIDSDFIKKMQMFNATILLIVGPSGVGKSTVAKELSKNNKISIIPNYTTRKKRESDLKEHFIHLKNVEFINLYLEKYFFFIRTKGNISYGYSKNDILNAIEDNKLITFMFRHNGAEYFISNYIECKVVILEACPKMILRHSEDKENNCCIDDVKLIIEKNRAIRVNKKENCILVKNNFNDFDSINDIVKEIKMFLGVYK